MNKTQMKENPLDCLGYKAEDLVTGIKGVVTSVSYDLYGCIQLALNPGLDETGKRIDTLWYDIGRVEIIGKKPVMEQPSFEVEKGPEDKPAPT